MCSSDLGHSEYVGCGDCGHRFLWEPAGDGSAASEELDWGDGATAGDYVALYPSTSRPQIVGMLLILAALAMLTTAVLLNDMLSNPNMIEDITTIANQKMEGAGMQSETPIDQEFVRSAMNIGIIGEMFCTVLATAGGVLVLMRQNYTLVLAGCAVAIVGMGAFLLSTLFGAIALYLVLQSRSEFGIIEEESW